MKVRRMVAVLCAAFVAVASASASGLNSATAGALTNDADNYMSVTDWQQVTFKNVFAQSAIQSSTLDFGIATKLGKKGYGAFSFDGNLWSDTPNNQYGLLYGTGNMGFRVQLNTAKQTTASVTNSTTTFMFNWGMNFKAGKVPAQVYALVGYTDVSKTVDYRGSGVSGTVTESGSSMPIVSAGALFNFYKRGMVDQYLGANLVGTFMNNKDIKTTVYDASGNGTSASTANDYSFNTFIIALLYKVNVKFDNNFTYSGTVSVPFTFTSNSISSDYNTTAIDFTISNGFQAFIKPGKFAINGGLGTVLPGVADSAVTGVKNVIYVGTTWNPNQAFTLETSASLSGVTFSCDEAWNTKFGIYLMGRF